MRKKVMEKQEQRQRKLVLVPCPFQGHINPMLQLGTILHSKGFFSMITVAHTRFNFPDPSNHPHLTFLPLADDGLSYEDLTEDFTAFVWSLNKNCTNSLHESLSKMIQALGPHDELPCIIYDGFMFFTEAVANSLKLPSIVLRTTSATTFLTYYAIPRLQEGGLFPPQDSKLLELVPDLEPLRFKDLAGHNYQYLDSLLQLLAATRNIGSSSAVICNSIDWLEQSSINQLQQICQVPIFTPGPIHKIAPKTASVSILKEDTNCIAWLDKQEPSSVIYVSLGSIASMDEKEVMEMAWGLANSRQPFLWVIRPGSVKGIDQLLPQGFVESVGERGCIVKWAPQRDVLAHKSVGGFWSHCGWNSTLESLSEGVPMICNPRFGDQKMNTRMLSYVLKVGLEVENELERGEIERYVKLLMVDKEGKEMKQRAINLKENINLCINGGGSSNNSLNKLVDFILSI